MAITDETGGMNYNMPVVPMGGNGGGFGGFGGDGWGWLILLFLVFGNGWGGGFGGNNIAADGAAMYPWMNQANQINDGFRDQMLNSSVMGIQNSITSGFGDVATALCGGFAGVNASINGGVNSLSQQMNANQLAALERSFAAQTANTAGMTGLSSQLAQCCCDNRAATADVKYTIATEACANRATSTANTQAILDKLCQLEMDNYKSQVEAKNDTIAQLRSELIFARGQASQDVQTAAIQAGQRALANEVEQYVAPRAVPAYYVQNPNCCGYNTGCGCAA